MRTLTIIIMFLVLTSFAFACKDIYRPDEEVLIQDVIEEIGDGADCNLTVYNSTELVHTALMTRFGLAYKNVVGVLPEAGYISNIECNLSNASFLGQCNFVVLEANDNKMIIAAIILLPMILAFIFIFSTLTLSEEHNALRISLFLLTPVTFWASLHFGLTGIIKFYNFPELELLIGTTTYWTGWIFFIMLAYFLLYIFYKAVHTAAQKKHERLNY